MLIPVAVFVGVTAVCVHAFHLWMMGKLLTVRAGYECEDLGDVNLEGAVSEVDRIDEAL
jgi:hypothetical protein